MTLTGAVLSILGAWWSYPTLLGVGAALLGAVLLDLALVARTPTPRIARVVEPTVVERHGECWATLSVTGPRPLGAQITVEDRVDGHVQCVELTQERTRYRVPTSRRGLLEVGPLMIHRWGMFGLAVATSTQGAVDRVRVLPRLIPVQRLPHGHRRAAVGADESVEHGGTDLLGLHEYLPGDDLRRLHGPTSARTGRLMVRDDAEPATPHLTVVLDDTAAHYADEHAFEDAVEVAFALCRLAEEQSRPAHLVTVSGVIDEAVVAADHVGRQRLRTALAEVQPTHAAAVEGSAVRAARGMRLARGLDTVAIVSGAAAPVEAYAAVAGRGTSGVLLLLDPGHPSATGVGAVDVLRGPSSVDLVRLWDRAVQ